MEDLTKSHEGGGGRGGGGSGGVENWRENFSSRVIIRIPLTVDLGLSSVFLPPMKMTSQKWAKTNIKINDREPQTQCTLKVYSFSKL